MTTDMDNIMNNDGPFLITKEAVVDYIRLKEKERRQMNKTGYYTKEVAKKTLGFKDDGAFYKCIRDNDIRRTHGKYLKRDVDRVAEMRMEAA